MVNMIDEIGGNNRVAEL